MYTYYKGLIIREGTDGIRGELLRELYKEIGLQKLLMKIISFTKSAVSSCQILKILQWNMTDLLRLKLKVIGR